MSNMKLGRALDICKHCFFVYAEPQTGPACGRLLVLVQKGKRFISSGKIYNFSIKTFQFLMLADGCVSLYWKAKKFIKYVTLRLVIMLAKKVLLRICKY